MSAPTRTIADLHDAVVASCWRQWSAIGGRGTAQGDDAHGDVVDPEALIVLTTFAAASDARLDERLRWWSRVGSGHTSVQRLRSIGESTPDAQAWRRFATYAAMSGRANWRKYATQIDSPLGPDAGSSQKRDRDAPSLSGWPALMLRLRFAFGVGAKADILGLLLADPQRGVTAREAALELAYSESTTKRAADDMVRSGLVRSSGHHPTAYFTHIEPWIELLELDRTRSMRNGRWSHLARLVPFVLDALHLGATSMSNTYVHSSRARDLIERHRLDLTAAGVQSVHDRIPAGEAQLESFESIVREVTERLVR